jgi:predicted P-loop ATPase
MGDPPGQRNRVLVLDGRQSIGKSYFVRWLASPLPAHYHEGAIVPEDKDCRLRAASTWIWEVAEFGSTTRRADREALKFFLSRQWVRERKPYGRRDISKPALASFIGTLNDEAGFLSDPTGSQRFMCCTLTSIDWDYSKELDINKVWGQAVALWRAGEPWELTPEELAKVSEINANYEITDPLAQRIVDNYEIDATQQDWRATTADIIDAIRANEWARGSDRELQVRLGAILTRFGLKQRRIGHERRSLWTGVHRRVVAL